MSTLSFSLDTVVTQAGTPAPVLGPAIIVNAKQSDSQVLGPGNRQAAIQSPIGAANFQAGATVTCADARIDALAGATLTCDSKNLNSIDVNAGASVTCSGILLRIDVQAGATFTADSVLFQQIKFLSGATVTATGALVIQGAASIAAAATLDTVGSELYRVLHTNDRLRLSDLRFTYGLGVAKGSLGFRVINVPFKHKPKPKPRMIRFGRPPQWH